VAGIGGIGYDEKGVFKPASRRRYFSALIARRYYSVQAAKGDRAVTGNRPRQFEVRPVPLVKSRLVLGAAYGEAVARYVQSQWGLSHRVLASIAVVPSEQFVVRGTLPPKTSTVFRPTCQLVTARRGIVPSSGCLVHTYNETNRANLTPMHQ
jgi:hypothetical protein